MNNYIDEIPENDINPIQVNGDLIIRAGDPPHTIPSGSIYLYNNIHIEKNAKLVVEGATKDWTEIYAIKDFIIEGSIEVIGFRTPRNPIETIEREAYDGRVLKFTYKNNNKGGNGGDGGSHNHTATAKPGDGTMGSILYGGGGGGGTGWARRGGNQRGGISQPGGNAKENLGGHGGRGSGIGGDGGSGARRSDRGDGGLLYLSTGGRFLSKNGRVLIYGADGLNAQSGANGDAYRGGNGGGGGGGAPGNHGGCVIVSADIVGQGEWPKVIAHGGIGGARGGAGSGWHQSGKNGKQGEDGNSGRFIPKRYISPI